MTDEYGPKVPIRLRDQDEKHAASVPSLSEFDGAVRRIGMPRATLLANILRWVWPLLVSCQFETGRFQDAIASAIRGEQRAKSHDADDALREQIRKTGTDY